jgi:Fur family ferric uptake transcriptional regulator
MISWTESTLATLRARGLREGGARRAVVELLGEQPCCVSAQEIYDTLRAKRRRVGLASVYRTLDQLSADGHLQKVELGDAVTRYEPVLADGEHHHHLVCDGCGKVEAFADDRLEQALHRVEDDTGYRVAAHEVVLHGACGDCK